MSRSGDTCTAEELEVVADVADDRDRLGPRGAGERVDAAGAAQTARQHDELAYAHSMLAIVPVKGLDGAKTRLAPALAPDERARLVVDMLDRVLAACEASTAITRTLLVTPEPELARNGVEVLRRTPGQAILTRSPPGSRTPAPATVRSSSWPTALA